MERVVTLGVLEAGIGKVGDAACERISLIVEDEGDDIELGACTDISGLIYED